MHNYKNKEIFNSDFQSFVVYILWNLMWKWSSLVMLVNILLIKALLHKHYLHFWGFHAGGWYMQTHGAVHIEMVQSLHL